MNITTNVIHILEKVRYDPEIIGYWVSFLLNGHKKSHPVTGWLFFLSWGERWDSNPRQPVPQTGALPTELRSPYGAC